MDPEGVGEPAGEGGGEEGMVGKVDTDLMSNLDEYSIWRSIWLLMGWRGDLPKRTCRQVAR